MLNMCAKLYLLSLSSLGVTLKTIKWFRIHLRKYPKVRIILKRFMRWYIEKKTIVLDIDETCVFATTNK